MKDLAVHLYTENGGNPVVEYSLLKDKGNWKDAFFGREEEKQLLRESCPLTRSGNQYRFIHKSLLEYFVVQALLESLDALSVPETRRGSDASVYSFENQPISSTQTGRDLSLAPKHWVSDLGIVRLLTERVQKEPTFKEQLLTIINRSKMVDPTLQTNQAIRKAAANAITILVKAGVPLSEQHWEGIQIPGADLSYGVFDHTNFKGADLRKVNFQGAWLRGADVSGAHMNGVQFGEWPMIQLESAAYACAYSPDGKWLAIGTGHKIKVYDAKTLKEKHTLRGHTSEVRSVGYSPDGKQIASGSSDKTVRLWDAQTGQCLAVMQGFHSAVYSVAWHTPQEGEDWLVTGSADKAVRLWKVTKDGDRLRVALRWTSTQKVLNVDKMNIEGVVGLDSMNTRLLQQRGAKGEPAQT